MAFLKNFIENIKDKPFNIESPQFRKEFSMESNQINDLQELLNDVEENKKAFIEKDIRLLKAGLVGEQNVYYEIKNSFLPLMCFHDLRIVYKDFVAQLDFVIISPNKIYVLECKKLVGDIEINKNGDFTRIFKTREGKFIKKEGIYSPITQNQRHVEIVKMLFKEELGFKRLLGCVEDLVVIANPKTVVNDRYAPKEIKQKIMKYDQVITYMKNAIAQRKEDEFIFTRHVEMMAECLLRHHQPIKIDYIAKYQLQKVEESNQENLVMSEQVAITSDDKVEEAKELEIKEKNQQTPSQIEQNTNSEDLYEKLRLHRLAVSKEEKVAPYYIFNNTTLDQLITAMPRTMEDLMKVQGFGKVKCEKYGKAILQIISSESCS